MEVQCNLAALRQRRGFSAAELARRVGVQRQTIYSIESGAYVPNTAVALLLARELEVGVEELFALPAASPSPAAPIAASVVSASQVKAGMPVRLARSGERWWAFPQENLPCFLPDADGMVTKPAKASRPAQVIAAGEVEEAEDRLLVAGCDPALGLLAAASMASAGVSVLPVSACSRTAIEWLRQRYVHVAGCHIEDRATGEFNVPALLKMLPGEDLLVLTFAEWEEGFVVSPGNPHGLREAGDLANPKVRLMNREPGSGSRALLDELLRKAGLGARRVNGYGHVALSHMAAARAVFEGQADCCIATSSAARAFQMDFIPLRRERFDLVARKEHLHLAGMRALLDALQRQSLRRKLETLAGYDTRRSGCKVID
ncbi:MAG: helix-turn-helix domain-containing protein [Bryobacterales bacterium]|nr:helix-turn-helix domain-containing protein [Bryobacterales bacterium]